MQVSGFRFQVSVDDARWQKALPGYEKIIESALAALATSLRAKRGNPPLTLHSGLLRPARNDAEVSILLTSDKKIRQLNKQYRNKDKPTNVLSFPQNEPGMLGDIALALETIKREAAEQEKTFKDHFTHLFVHGVLHLLGHDHMEKSEQRKMEKLEIKILTSLGISNPYV